MFCTKCGKELPNDAEFCVECGIKIVRREPGKAQGKEEKIEQKKESAEPVESVRPVEPGLKKRVAAQNGGSLEVCLWRWQWLFCWS